ncbi:MAG: NAD(P)H-dependent glycerol-3-phosphate dehydrogenase [Alphaproteobacteria bacterium]|nr:NAD(P)H-dependent glycerol-3-phosphate dehydrogenase [Alphaproteobacteria bacterium]
MTTSSAIKHIAVIGAGSWGTALGDIVRRAGGSVILYARDPSLADTINARHENPVYLPGLKLHDDLRATSDIAAALEGADMVLAVTPVQFLREMCGKLKPHLKAGVPVVNCAKGIEIATGQLPAAIVAEELPQNPYAVLSGPTFASEVIRGLPAAASFATAAPPDHAAVWAQALKSPTFRPYIGHDVAGVDAAGAIKNVIAIACGIVEGQSLGQNARAAVMTRGMAEIRRFGMTRGAKAETFLGLSGVGDLMLTCNSMTSRNFSLGHALGQGQSLGEIMDTRRTVAEGVATARALAMAAHTSGIDMPICGAIDKILHHGAKVTDMIHDLLSRAIKTEAD